MWIARSRSVAKAGEKSVCLLRPRMGAACFAQSWSQFFPWFTLWKAADTQEGKRLLEWRLQIIVCVEISWETW